MSMLLGFVLLLAVPIILMTRVRLRERITGGFCLKCAYDLRGSMESAVCPECGTTIVREVAE